VPPLRSDLAELLHHPEVVPKLGAYATHQVVLIALMRIPGHNWPQGARALPQLVALCSAKLLGAVVMTMVIKRIPLLRRSL